MADYWKSNPRKFCDFCKCWFADNKASRDFHERGKRHKENVEKKIGELTKKGQKQYETQKELDGFLKQMEEGAMKSFKKDVSANPDLIPEYKVALVEKRVKEAEGQPTALTGSRYEPSQSTSTSSAAATSSSAPSEGECEWIEGVTPEGHKYYWNTVTEASRWDEPENFKKADGDSGKKKETKSTDSENKDSKPTTSATSSKKPTSAEGECDWIEGVSPEGHKYYWNKVTAATQWVKPDNFIPADQKKKTGNKKKMKEESSSNSSSDDEEDEKETETESRGVKRGGDAYGGWSTISTEEYIPPDLQLPEANQMYTSMYVPQAAQFAPREKFTIREKTVGNIGGTRNGDGASVSFKKRKAGGRQIRSRDATS